MVFHVETGLKNDWEAWVILHCVTRCDQKDLPFLNQAIFRVLYIGPKLPGICYKNPLKLGSFLYICERIRRKIRILGVLPGNIRTFIYAIYKKYYVRKASIHACFGRFGYNIYNKFYGFIWGKLRSRGVYLVILPGVGSI
jgi:hypothetical protein